MDYSINNNEIIIASADDRETIQYVYDTICTHKGVIECAEWQSRYNNYVVYGYEPSCPEMFKLTITLKSGLVYNDFILFHLSQQVKNVEHLEKCLTI